MGTLCFLFLPELAGRRSKNVARSLGTKFQELASIMRYVVCAFVSILGKSGAGRGHTPALIRGGIRKTFLPPLLPSLASEIVDDAQGVQAERVESAKG